MRLSKAPRKVYPHARRRRPAGGPRRGRASTGRERHRRAVPPHPRRDRRRVLHGRRHRAAARASSRRPRRRRGRLRRRRARLAASSAATAAARSTTSGSHGRVAIQVGTLSQGGRRRSAATSPARRPCATSSSSGRGRSSSRRRHPPAVAAACREAIRVMQEEPELHERLWANTRRFKAELARLGFDTGRSRDADHARDDGRPGDRRSASASGCSRRACSRQPVVFPTVAHRPGPDPDDRDRGAHADEQLDRALEAFATVGRELGLIAGERGLTPTAAATRATTRHRRAGLGDLPLDAHLHTDLSPDSDVPIDAYARAGRRARDRRDRDHRPRRLRARRRPAYAFATFEDRERVVREAAERWAAAGRRDPVRRRDHLRPRATRPTSATTSRRHAYDFVIGCVHVCADSPFTPSRVAAWVAGRPLAEIVAPYFDEVLGGDPVRPVRHDRPPRLRQALPRAARDARRASPPRRSCTSRSSRRSSRPAPRSRSTRAASASRRARRTRRAAIVARYRVLGGTTRDHRVRCPPNRARSHRASGRRIVSSPRAGFDALAFRRGAERVHVAVRRAQARRRREP